MIKLIYDIGSRFFWSHVLFKFILKLCVSEASTQGDQILEYTVAKMFLKVAQKVATAFFTYLRARFYKIAQKVANHLGYFC